MTTTAIREQLVDYMRTGDENKVMAIYALVKDEINTAENDWDEDFTREMERRSKGMMDGTAKTYTWEEVKASAIRKFKEKKKRS